MRMKVLVLSALLLLALFTKNVYSVNWNSPESQTVDQMFRGDSGAGVPPDGEYASPQASRAAQAEQENKAIINLPIGGTLSTGATDPQQARNEERNQINSNQPVVTKTTEPVQPMASSDTTSVTGSWSLELNDSTLRTADLTLVQSGDAV